MASRTARSWRDRWAERESQRRQGAYQLALAEWQNDELELTRMIESARSYRGSTDSGTVVLKRDERIFYSLPSVSLVEVQRGPGQYVGGYSGFSFRLTRSVRYNVGGSRGTYVQGAEQLQITDEGSAMITGQRLVFTGTRNTREWAYSKLVSIEHDPQRPVTMVGVSNRQKVSGLIYAVDHVGGARFGLSLALAHYRDDVAGFVASLEAEQTTHRATRATEPEPARPEEASAWAAAFGNVLRTIYTGKSHWKPRSRIALGVASSLLTIGLISSAAGAGGSSGATQTAAVVDLPAASEPADTAAADAAAARGQARAQALEARQQARAAAARQAARIKARREARAVARHAERERQARIARRQALAAQRQQAAAAAAAATDPRFDYCYNANDAGYGNYVQGQDPEYYWYDDADHDGIVCEF